MEQKKINLFIVDDDQSMVAAIKQYLNNKFGKKVQISTFFNGESCLEKINDQTDVVLLDYFLNGKNGVEILKEIKKINPKTEVIMLTSHEDIATAIESIRIGAKDYIVKGKNSLQKMKSAITKVITKPVKVLVKEFGVSKFMLLFSLTFLIMAVVVVWVLRLFYR